MLLEKKARGEAHLLAWFKYQDKLEEMELFTQIFHWPSSWEFLSDLTRRSQLLPSSKTFPVEDFFFVFVFCL